MEKEEKDRSIIIREIEQKQADDFDAVRLIHGDIRHSFVLDSDR